VTSDRTTALRELRALVGTYLEGSDDAARAAELLDALEPAEVPPAAEPIRDAAPVVYRDVDLTLLMPLFDHARALVAEDAAKGRDEGTSVLGAGIAVRYRAPRKRAGSYVRKIVVAAPFQGNVGSSRASQRALEYLRTSGVDVYWDDGRMD
jgi:hypothetical protein